MGLISPVAIRLSSPERRGEAGIFWLPGRQPPLYAMRGTIRYRVIIPSYLTGAMGQQRAHHVSTAPEV